MSSTQIAPPPAPAPPASDETNPPPPPGAADPNGKPTEVYTKLIYDAIEGTANKKATLLDIYTYLTDTYPYFKNKEAEAGWKNSIRHSLTMHKSFNKVPRETGDHGKGGYWVVDEAVAKDEILRLPRRGRKPVGPDGVKKAAKRKAEGGGGAGKKSKGPVIGGDILDWNRMHHEVQTLAASIQPSNIEVVVGITRGGVVPARILCTALGVADMHCITISKNGGKHTVMSDIKADLKGRHVLLVEDMLESGATLAAGKAHLEASGALVKTAALYSLMTTMQPVDFCLSRVESRVGFPWE